jgi:hypothetical protein
MAKVQEAETERRYRSVIPLTGGSIGAFGFFFLGIGMVIDGVHAGIGETVVGAFVVAIAGMLAALVASTFAELTPTGLAYRYNFRHKTIPWASIESFRIARGPGTGPWSSLVIELRGNGPVLVGSIVGTNRYVRRVIEEIEAFRAQIRPAAGHEHDQQSPDNGWRGGLD